MHRETCYQFRVVEIRRAEIRKIVAKTFMATIEFDTIRKISIGVESTYPLLLMLELTALI